ncbi:MAG: alpha-1,2-fucosyltransferase [Spirochaetaceae bacterium]|jgi:hypothetical protein|nr:alpha-1,2-fucosyltransferase [Spirochaetaceae bacterium]
MIVIRLMGGLGNQMFIYAFGKSLSKKIAHTILFDTSSFVTGKREFELPLFPNIKLDIATMFQSLTAQGFDKEGAAQRLRNKKYGNSDNDNFFVIEEDRCDPEFLSSIDNGYCSGYFQDERYFLSVRDELLNDFSFVPFAAGDAYNNSLQEKILRCANPVAVHIRRGDYLAFNYPLCSLSYYNAAAKYILDRFSDAAFFVFGEDEEWINEKFKIDCKFKFVYLQAKGAGADMQLMTMCRHHIIANSSYSWWGAWLPVYPQKIVIAPDNFDMNQVCANWVCLPAGPVPLTAKDKNAKRS